MLYYQKIFMIKKCLQIYAEFSDDQETFCLEISHFPKAISHYYCYDPKRELLYSKN